MVNETFGERLRYLRQERGLNQIKLAELIGAGKSSISSWERDESEPTLSKLIAIADFFGCTIDYLAGRED